MKDEVRRREPMTSADTWRREDEPAPEPGAEGIMKSKITLESSDS